VTRGRPPAYRAGVADGRAPRTSYPARVVAVEPLLPRLIGVTFGGRALRELPEPTPGGHLRIAFTEEEDEGPEARYGRRTFTPRRFDREAGEVHVEFVLHGTGLAADWARTATVGDPVVISGPGGRYRPEPVAGRFVIVVDDAGLPAAGTVIEALPLDTEILVLAEVTDGDDERALTPEREVEVAWLHRAPTGAEPGALLEERVGGVPDAAGAGWFVASEARTVRRIHRHLLEEREVPPDAVEARGYWRRRDSA
jgi:NADPH-dependent ferric siderophore reductase